MSDIDEQTEFDAMKAKFDEAPDELKLQFLSLFLPIVSIELLSAAINDLPFDSREFLYDNWN